MIKVKLCLVVFPLIAAAVLTEFYFKTSVKIYELYPDKIIFCKAHLLNDESRLYQFLSRQPKILDGTSHFEVQTANTTKVEFFSPYFLSLPDLYDTNDLTEIIYSSNIGLRKTKWYIVSFRNETFYNFGVQWLPKSMSSDTFYWVKGVVKRLPHLHTRDPISKGRMYDFGINTSSDYLTKATYQVFIFPPHTKIIETFGMVPTHRLTYEDQIVFLYELREKGNVSMHVKFILPCVGEQNIDTDLFLNFLLEEINK